MTNEISAESGDLDLDSMADFWMGGTGSDETPTTEPAPEGHEGETPQGETSNEVTPPVRQDITITPELRQQIAREEIEALTVRAREEQSRREIEALLANGTDEEVAAFTRKQIADAQEQARLDALGNERASAYAAQLIPSLLTDEFVSKLTPEQAQSLLPENFNGSDSDYLRLITDIQAAQAKTGLFGEDEVERRVQERLKAGSNAARGNALRSPSVTATPQSNAAAGGGEAWETLEGSAKLDAIWAQANEELGL